MGASAAAAILIRESHIVAAFHDAGATSAAAANTPAALGVAEHAAFHKLVRREVLVEAGPGRYWLDEERWQVMRRMRQRFALVLGIVMLAFLLFTLARQR